MIFKCTTVLIFTNYTYLCTCNNHNTDQCTEYFNTPEISTPFFFLFCFVLFGPAILPQEVVVTLASVTVDEFLSVLEVHTNGLSNVLCLAFFTYYVYETHSYCFV